MYEAPISMYDRTGNDLLRCKRCRSEVDDPNAFSPEISYVDCDSHSLVYLFPYLLSADIRKIKIRNGYLALIICEDGTLIWLDKETSNIPSDLNILHIYFICLSPRITWGIRYIKGFGSFGVAQLSLTEQYVEDFCKTEDNVKALEKDLKNKVNNYLSVYVQKEMERNNLVSLEQKNGYNNALRTVVPGIVIKKIDLIGYRHENGQNYIVAQHINPVIENEEVQKKKVPVSIIKLPLMQYTVRRSNEDVFFRKNGKCERHKSGEEIRPEKLRGVYKGFRFQSKEFDLSNGWGVYNVSRAKGGFFSAHGTISFYIDNTAQLGAFLCRTKDWNTFEEQFFASMLKSEISAALKLILDSKLEQKQVDSKTISKELNAMSFELTNRLNAEDLQTRDPPFRACGLRVKQIDIMNMDLYSDRR